MKGIDISEFQTNVDYNKLKEQGIEFVIIRCGYGKNEYQKDSCFEKHFEGCKNAGLKVGTYLYSYANTVEGARKEAENCLKFINGKQFDLPIFYDVEDDKTTATADKYTLTKMCEEFCRIIQNAGYKAGVYANLYWFENKLYVNELEKYSLWLAQWNKTMDANFKVDFWQYGKRHIEGIKGEVDLDKSLLDNKESIIYKVGQVYTTKVDLNVRTGHGKNFRIKHYDELTEDGKKHAYKQYDAVLKPNTRVTCLDVFKNNDEIWIKIPSGFVCAYYHGKYYIK